jgi:uncharacterized protein (TIGR02466 family)
MERQPTINGVYPVRVSDTWWESPVWEMQTEFDDAFNKNLLEEIYSIGQGIASGQDSSPHNSLWDYQLPHLEQLKTVIHQVVSSTAGRYMPSEYQTTFDFIMGWVNVKAPGECIEAHGHPDCTIAVTYYIQAEENSGNLTLLDTGKELNWQREILNGESTLQVKQIVPKAGKLVFFPGYVLHRIEPNRSNNLRISLSTDLKHTVDPSSPGAPILRSWTNQMLKIRDWKNVS